MPSVFKPAEINVQSLVYSVPKVNSMGGQTVFVNDTCRNKIRIHTPKCYLPFGVSEYSGAKSLQMSLNGDAEQMQQFKKFLNDFDMRNIDVASENSNAWFKKSLNANTVSELYNRTLKNPNPNYPPMFKAKLPFKDGNFVGEVYDTNKKLIDFSNITKACHVEAIVELTGVYFVAKEFGLSWKVIQLRVHPSDKVFGYAFADSASDDDSDAEP
jgi:hypothetical protein